MPCTHSDRGGTAESSQTASEATLAVVVKGLKAAVSQWYCRATVKVLPPHAAWVAKCLGDGKNTQLTTASAEDMFQTNSVLPLFQLKAGRNLLGYRHKPSSSAQNHFTEV